MAIAHAPESADVQPSRVQPSRVEPSSVQPAEFEPALAALVEATTGRVVLPGSEDYDTARRIRNLAFDRRPAVIVKAANAHDVAQAVRFARETARVVAVRSGGHSLAGHSTGDDAVVIDLSAMKGIQIDPDRRLAWAETGLTAGEYTLAAAAHGLATPFGDAGSVGLGGITLGGGIGFLVRKHGLTIDSLVAAEVVTADGRLVLASESQHPELFWAIRGGGGNFGIVTRFQFRLHPVATVLAGALILPATRDTLRSLVPIAASAPEEFTAISNVMPIPPTPFTPPESIGQLGLMILFVHAGDPAEGQGVLDQFRAVAKPIAEVVMPMPYPGIYEFTAATAEPAFETIRSAFVSTLDDRVVDAILDAHADPAAPPMSVTQIRVLGGAMARVRDDATAFAHRQAPILVAAISAYEGPGHDGPATAFTSRVFEAVRPNAQGVYSNFLQDEGEARVREAYPNGAYERLVAVKRSYDPTNVFSRNQNIRPDA